ncbi:MAG: hypothetical protein DLM53_04150 [Candidatus Eremiobacter antarcticus]|nr:hypothetical protein [Candidatus Eremiobacteraeota bacterium]MBC5807210.1 hypothetical protein [Candidatus Eremiobacteraeota bacterium]PZR62618.1 MAG: hypothetical protein DLM53_04150 [Candidatus Eremiobacter sp. RRmetagenome_bin22]
MKGSPQTARPKAKPRPPRKGQTWIGGLRRLSKKDRQRLYRRFTWVFLILFIISIAGGIIIGLVKPANH